MQCVHPGCNKGTDTGHALYRVSPKGKGQKFEGKCEEHYEGEPDPVVKDIVSVFEEDNRKRED